MKGKQIFKRKSSSLLSLINFLGSVFINGEGEQIFIRELVKVSGKLRNPRNSFRQRDGSWSFSREAEQVKQTDILPSAPLVVGLSTQYLERISCEKLVEYLQADFDFNWMQQQHTTSMPVSVFISLIFFRRSPE